MKRYDSLSMTHRPMCESKEGDWVKYADAKGIIEENQKLKETLDYPGDIPLMIQRAIKKEREDCALICEEYRMPSQFVTLGEALEECVIKIRARGEK